MVVMIHYLILCSTHEVRQVGRKNNIVGRPSSCAFSKEEENVYQVKKSQVSAPLFCDPIKNGLNVICNCLVLLLCDHVKIKVGNC